MRTWAEGHQEGSNYYWPRIAELEAAVKQLRRDLQVAANRFDEAADWFGSGVRTTYGDTPTTRLSRWSAAANGSVELADALLVEVEKNHVRHGD